MRITRRFHPVGQGAFYSEVINTDKEIFCIVYDCGASPRASGLSSAIQSSRLPKEIDILFISHFDVDHISGVAELLKNHQVKNIFIPFLSKAQELYFRTLFRVIAISYTILVYFIRSVEDDTPDTNNEESIEDSEGTLYRIISISSSIEILDKITTHWKYKLFYSKGENSRQKSIDKDILALEQYFKSENINSEQDLLNYQPTDLQKILKGCNEKIGTGRKNRYCLCVLSTPVDPKINRRFTSINICCNHCYHVYCCRWVESPTCLYLGDSSLKSQNTTNKLTEKLLKYYEDELRWIETIQVPHHGSSENHNIDFYRKLPNLKFAVCSFGLGNNYKHPGSQVVKDIVIHGYYFISVTQRPCSEYIQIYDEI